MKIRYHKQAEKFILSQSKVNARRIRDAVIKLPLGDVKKTQGNHNPVLYRLRVGDYRIIFSMGENAIDVVHADNRGDVYKRL